MSSPIKLVLKVRDIPGEYAVVAKMLCPSCEHPLVKETQHVIEGKDNRIKGDLLKLKCTNKSCGNQIMGFSTFLTTTIRSLRGNRWRAFPPCKIR